MIRDIKPGNEYRETDLRSTSKFQSGNVKAQFDGIEYPRFDKFGTRDLNGGEDLTDLIMSMRLSECYFRFPPRG